MRDRKATGIQSALTCALIATVAACGDGDKHKYSVKASASPTEMITGGQSSVTATVTRDNVGGKFEIGFSGSDCNGSVVPTKATGDDYGVTPAVVYTGTTTKDEDCVANVKATAVDGSSDTAIITIHPKPVEQDASGISGFPLPVAGSTKVPHVTISPEVKAVGKSKWQWIYKIKMTDGEFNVLLLTFGFDSKVTAGAGTAATAPPGQTPPFKQWKVNYNQSVSEDTLTVDSEGKPGGTVSFEVIYQEQLANGRTRADYSATLAVTAPQQR